MFTFRIDVYHHQVEPRGLAARYARRLEEVTARIRASNESLRAKLASLEQPNRGEPSRHSRGDLSMSTDALEQAFQNLEAEAEANETVDGSAGVVIDQLLALVETNKNSPQRIQAIVDRMRVSREGLLEKIVAGTPQDPGTGGGEGGGGTGTEGGGSNA